MEKPPTTRMNCDAIARYYEFFEHLSFGKRLEQTRFAFLPRIKFAQRAIVCGGGDGRFLARLLQTNPAVRVDFVELSPKMIALAKRRIASLSLAQQSRVRFHNHDIREFAPRPEGYDLIATHFFLDCFCPGDLPEVVANLSSWGTANAKWVVSDFREKESLLGRLWTTAIIRALYAAFWLTTGLRVIRLPNYLSAISSAGFRLSCEENLLAGLLHSSIWAKLTTRQEALQNPCIGG